MSSEKSLLSKLELLASSIGNVLFRNNTGSAYAGQVTRLPSGDILIKNPRLIKFGLAEGSGDLIGGTKIIITPEMVGRKLLVFTSYEVKTKTTRTTKEQINWANAITNMGGIAIIDRFNSTDSIGENTYEESIRKFSATR
jgi:hypothetical protein